MLSSKVRSRCTSAVSLRGAARVAAGLVLTGGLTGCVGLNSSPNPTPLPTSSVLSPPGLLTAAPMRVVAIGDSVPSGTGATSFVDRLGAALAKQDHRLVTVSNDAVAGATSSDALARLDTAPVHRDVAAADIVILEVGANDLDETRAGEPGCAPVRQAGCYTSEVTDMRSNLRSLLNKLNNVTGPNARIVVMGYWNVFKDGAPGRAQGAMYVGQGEALARWVNGILKRLAEHENVTYADAYTPFYSGGDVDQYLQADGDHPNDAGHELLANAVLKALGRPASA